MTKRTKTTKTKTAIEVAAPEPVATPRRRRRRRRRSATTALSLRTITEIRAKKRQFLKDVSTVLTEALGFQVRVSLVAPNRMEGFTPDMRRAARMSKKDARAQIRDAFAPLPVTKNRDGSASFVAPPALPPGPKLLETMLNEPFKRAARKRQRPSIGAPGLDDEVGF